jgi:hypothetical protein
VYSRLCIEIFGCLLSVFLAVCGACDVCMNGCVEPVLLVLWPCVVYVPVFTSLHVRNWAVKGMTFTLFCLCHPNCMLLTELVADPFRLIDSWVIYRRFTNCICYTGWHKSHYQCV